MQKPRLVAIQKPRCVMHHNVVPTAPNADHPPTPTKPHLAHQPQSLAPYAIFCNGFALQ